MREDKGVLAQARYKGRVISVQSRKSRLPNGRVALLDIVEHPGAVLIVPFLARDAIILLRQYRPAVRRYLWELPAGTLEKGETPFACARRETAEETGYRARRFAKIATIYPVPGYSTERIHVYRASGLQECPAAGDPDEIFQRHIFSRRKIRELFSGGKIVDAKTIAGLVLCGLL